MCMRYSWRIQLIIFTALVTDFNEAVVVKYSVDIILPTKNLLVNPLHDNLHDSFQLIM